MTISNISHTLPAAAALLLLPLSNWLAYRWYTRRSVPKEVAENAAAIAANGSQDNLRRGFHQRETWSRVWPWLGATVAGSLPAAIVSIPDFALSFVGLGALLGTYFARYFTPLLNLARGLAEFHASPDSASWPDATVYKQARAAYPNDPLTRAQLADALLQRLLTRTWLYGRWGYALLLVGAGVVAFNS